MKKSKYEAGGVCGLHAFACLGRTLTVLPGLAEKSVAARTRLWLPVESAGSSAPVPHDPDSRLLSYLILDFRMGAGPLPTKDLLSYFSARLRHAMTSTEAARARCAYVSCKTDEARHRPAVRLRIPTCGIP